MTKENYLKLKNELKELAIVIRNTKTEFKADQRIFDKAVLEHGSFMGLYKQLESLKITKTEFDMWYKQLSTFGDSMSFARSEKFNLKDTYRYKHIVYSLARGKTIEQIENKNAKDNEPSLSQINSVKEEYGFDDIDEERELRLAKRVVRGFTPDEAKKYQDSLISQAKPTGRKMEIGNV
jgi:hypothetical protein